MRGFSFFKLLLPIFIMVMFGSCASMEKQYQNDADIYRIKHLNYYGNLIDEYYEKNDVYPFEKKYDAPAYVFIANKKQQEYFNDSDPQKHYQISTSDFFAELESGLNRKVEEYYDPQLIPSYRPVFYIYMIDKNVFYFAVHFNSPNKFTKYIAKNYYKFELSNETDERYKLFAYKDLISNPDYNKLLNKEAKKNGWFKHQEETYKYETKSTNAEIR